MVFRCCRWLWHDQHVEYPLSVGVIDESEFGQDGCRRGGDDLVCAGISGIVDRTVTERSWQNNAMAVTAASMS